MKLICFGFYSITRNKWRYISDKSMLIRIKIFTRSSLGIVVFIHPPVLFNHAYPPYLSDHFIQIYLRSWSELNEAWSVPGNLARPRTYPRSSSSIEFVPPPLPPFLHSTSVQSSAERNRLFGRARILYYFIETLDSSYRRILIHFFWKKIIHIVYF